MRGVLPICVVALAALPAPAFAKDSVSFRARHAAEARLAVTARAPGAGWGTAGRESAVLSVRLDGREVTSVVLFGGAKQLTYRIDRKSVV